MLKGNVDICVMAHPSRKENVQKIQQALNLSDDSIFWDDRENGGDAMYTAKKAWQSPVPEGCTHRLVFQDDAQVCNNFLDILNIVARKYSNEVVTFLHSEDLSLEQRYYISNTFSLGCAIMIPVKYLNKMWWFIDNRIEVFLKPQCPEILKRDTSCIRAWMRHYNIKGVTTVPSLVQHIGDESLVGIKRHRIAPDFTMNPPLEGW